MWVELRVSDTPAWKGRWEESVVSPGPSAQGRATCCSLNTGCYNVITFTGSSSEPPAHDGSRGSADPVSGPHLREGSKEKGQVAFPPKGHQRLKAVHLRKRLPPPLLRWCSQACSSVSAR